MMKVLFSIVFLLASSMTCCAVEFERCVRLQGGNEPVRVESPGYAAPCWADVDGDGKKHLLVGQFNQGKIRVFKHLGDGKVRGGRWLQGRREGGRSARRVVMHQLHSTVCGHRRRRTPRHSLRLVLPHGHRTWPGCFKSCTASPTARFAKRKS